jgi:hypothetical protein
MSVNVLVFFSSAGFFFFFFLFKRGEGGKGNYNVT